MMRCGLAITCASTLSRPQCAAALDDLLERRDHRFSAVKPEALGSGEFDVAEFLEAFRFDQLVEDRALALARERDFLVGPFDALLNPALLSAVRNVQELDAQGLAIGALQNAGDLAQRAEFKAENFIEKDSPIEIGVRKPIGPGIEFLLVFGGLKT